MSKSFVTPASPFKREVIVPLWPFYIHSTSASRVRECVHVFFVVEAEKAFFRRHPAVYWDNQFAMGYQE